MRVWSSDVGLEVKQIAKIRVLTIPNYVLFWMGQLAFGGPFERKGLEK